MDEIAKTCDKVLVVGSGGALHCSDEGPLCYLCGFCLNGENWDGVRGDAPKNQHCQCSLNELLVGNPVKDMLATVP